MIHVVVIRDIRGLIEAELVTQHAIGGFVMHGENVSDALQRVVDEIERREVAREGIPD